MGPTMLDAVAHAARQVVLRTSAFGAPPGTGFPRHAAFRCLAPTTTPLRGCCAFSRKQALASSVKPDRGLPKRADNRKNVDDSVFDDLGLSEVYEDVGGIRTRQHVNPLKRELQIVTQPPLWGDVFADPTLPLTVDIGCGPGRFLLMLAQKAASGGGGGDGVGSGEAENFLGMEIRGKLVDRALMWAREIGLGDNTHFMATNATVSFESILSTYPGPLRLVCIQCPDPHFKKRHHKRRIVQPQLVEMIAGALPPGGRVFLQSDVEEVGVAMRDQFEKYGGGLLALHPLHDETGVQLPPQVLKGGANSPPALGNKFANAAAAAGAEGGAGEGGSKDAEEPAIDGIADDDAWSGEWGAGGWLPANPNGVPTEREQYSLSLEGGRMHRLLLVRK